MFRIFLLALALTSLQGAFQNASAQDVAHDATTTDSISEEQKVNSLITYIRTLEGATFIRNNSEYKPEQAAGHLQSKWQKHAAKVKTAEGFIMQLASESSDGTPYSIRFSDGKTIPTRDVLRQELQRVVSGQ